MPPLAPEIDAFGDGVHDAGETGLTVNGAGFGVFPGKLFMYENANGTGAVDELVVGTWGPLELSGVEIPVAPNNADGTRFLIVEREDLAWSQGFAFTLGAISITVPIAARRRLATQVPLGMLR